MHVHHHNHATHTGRPGNPKHTGGWLLAILLVAQLMVILDITAVNIAMPNIAKDLGISGTSISWTITSTHSSSAASCSSVAAPLTCSDAAGCS